MAGIYSDCSTREMNEILQFADFQDGGCPSTWNSEILFLTANHF